MTAQEEFDNKYISSSEICDQLSVHRCTVLLAVRTDRLPPPIVLKRPNGVPQIMLWERAPVQPVLDQWKVNLEAKRA